MNNPKLKFMENDNSFRSQHNREIFTEKIILDNIIQYSNEGIVILDPNGLIKKYNQNVLEILECSPNDLTNLFPIKIIPKLKSLNYNIIDFSSKQSSKELIVRKKSFSIGSEEYSLFFIIPLDPSQKEMAKKFKEIKILKEIYEKIINSIGEGIHTINTEGNIVIYNSALEKLEGYKASEVLGKHVSEIYNLDSTTSLLLKVLDEGRPIFNFHQEYTAKNGKYVDVVCSTVPLYTEDKIIGSAAILKDFSEFRKMAEKILDLQEKLTVKWSKTTNIQQKKKYTTFSQLLGSNKEFLQSIQWAKASSKTDSPVLVFGETGTGKELFAQSIHEESKRSQGPFMAINCAAIPENLLEGILFGTVKGAFTGAINRDGLLEQACGGSLFLDEINSMPLSLQAKILRVLEEKKVRRLGGNDEIPIDTRIISSCNVSPSVAIERGQIRSDLFYRLAVVYIFIPPLRDRLDDLELLSNFFIQNMNKELEKNVKGLHHEVISAFQTYDWPGNIRQLKHTIECSMNIISSDQNFITPAHIPQYLGLFNHNLLKPEKETTGKNSSNSILTQIKEQEKNKIISALKRSKGNVAKAAKELGISRQLLRYRMKRLGLK